MLSVRVRLPAPNFSLKEIKLRITIVEVTVEDITKGKSSYQKANVVYSFNGRNSNKTIVSFSNPQVFAFLRSVAPGTEVEVTTGKDAQGYSVWSNATAIASDSGATATGATPAPKSVKYDDQRETREERAMRQAFIIKQSSLSNAVAALTAGAKAPPAWEAIEQLADLMYEYVTWSAEKDLASSNSNIEDVPV